MNANPDSLPDVDAVPAEDGEPAVKPVRRRRAVKVADEASAQVELSEAGDVAAAADAGDAPESVSPLESPEAKPRRRKAAVAPSEAGSVADASAELPSQQIELLNFDAPATVLAELPLLNGDVPDVQALAGALAGPASLPATATNFPELPDEFAADAAPMEPHE